ncbi:hypothetical protein COV93_05645 [Candidatus Woesearchaeota archaeon CG11_big_fil_rev_8_21_14_0_20_43_8]|nr:MAG: hypothetical protein COV93_05645 [Candidatus Woesearchaeota archaeon CG11_big_fil_rev_8_21_14_0_20_43_8]
MFMANTLYKAWRKASYPFRQMGRGMLISADLLGTLDGLDSTVGGDAAHDQYNERDKGLVGHVIKGMTAAGVVGVVIASQSWPIVLGYAGVNLFSGLVNSRRRFDYGYKIREDKMARADYQNDMMDGKNPEKIEDPWFWTR